MKLKQFQRMVGKLRFASIAILMGKGLFSLLNRVMQGEPKFVGIGLKSETREALEDWMVLLDDIARRPTHVFELCPRRGLWDYIGYCDACADGAGGIWLPLDSSLPPILWRFHFPKDVERRFRENDGVTNSGLEMAGVMLALMVLEGQVPDL